MTPLDELHERFQHWFGHDYDLDAIDAVLAAAAVQRLNGDPLWLLLVSGPGGGKTETVNPLQGCGALVVSTISSTGALLSGTAKKERTANATGGLLRQLGGTGVIVLKDLTSILSLNPGVRAEILAALREIYDGRWTRTVGTDGGRTLDWEGRLTVVGAVTTAWDRAHAAVASMGDRFVLLRMDSTQHRLEAGRRAIANTGGELDMREELAQIVGEHIEGIDPTVLPELDEAEGERILAAADLVTLSRTAVEFDYRGDVVDSHAPEAPTRFAKQIQQVARGAIAIGLGRDQAMRLAIRCARDSMPPLRLEIIDDLQVYPHSTPTDVRKRLGKPRATVDRQLQALHILGVVDLDEEPGNQRTWWFYSLAKDVSPDALLVPDLSIKDTNTQKGCVSPDISGTNPGRQSAPIMNVKTNNRSSPGLCPDCGRAPARSDTGVCDFCSGKAERRVAVKP